VAAQAKSLFRAAASQRKFAQPQVSNPLASLSRRFFAGAIRAAAARLPRKGSCCVERGTDDELRFSFISRETETDWKLLKEKLEAEILFWEQHGPDARRAYY